MVEKTARIETTRDLFLYGSTLYSWCLDMGMNLQFSNCPNQSFFFDMLLCGSSMKLITAHFAESKLPVIASDDIGLAWIAVTDTERDNSEMLYLLGPFFTMEASNTYIQKMCEKSNLSLPLRKKLSMHLKSVPTVPFRQAMNFAVMLHLAVTGAPCSANDVFVKQQAEERSSNETYLDKKNSNFQKKHGKYTDEATMHGTWEMEQEIFRHVREGILSPFSDLIGTLPIGQVGFMSEDNIRQEKNENIIFAALCCRHAIQGGISPEGAYNLADYYIRRIESANTLGEIRQLSTELFETFTRRVHQHKQNKNYSPLVAAVIEYVETHVMEKIAPDSIAASLGYTKYYVTRRFQKEVGESLNDYVKRRKIAVAKELLDTGHISIVDISDKLAFSTPSYFSAIFRKETGMTPTEYASQKGTEPDARTQP